MQRLLTALAIAAGLAVAGSTPASAGGWAVTTLDPLTSLLPGEQVEVGFTIRQHGVSPVAVDGVAILVTDARGVTERFNARAQGPVGHYVTAVTFPAAGSYRWSVEQGWFGSQDLGTVRVGAADAVVGPGSDRWPFAWRAALPLLAVALLLAAAVDHRRRARDGVTARTVTYVIAAAAALVGSVVVWLTDRNGEASPVATADGTALDGASLFRAKGSATCHTGPDSSAGGEGFPDLSDASAWAGGRVPGMSAQDYVAQSIRDPIAVISPEFEAGAITTGMPSLTLSDEEVSALVAYLLAP